MTLKELNNLAQDLQDIEDNGDEDWLEAYIEATGCDLYIAKVYSNSISYWNAALLKQWEEHSI